MPSERCSLTVAIPTYDREEVLLQTLAQVVAERPTNAEILVIDQTPIHDAETVDRLKGWSDEGLIRVLCLAPPSLTAARNLALREAVGEIVLFLDDDVLVPPHLFEQHTVHYADPSVAAVTGQVWNCLNPEAPPGLEDPTRGTKPHSVVDDCCDASNISGGNHSARRALALGVGGYDQAFVGSALGEDMDFSQRLLAGGYRILYNPAAWIIHLGIKSGGCAVGVGSPWPEWHYASGLLLHAFRHGRQQGNFRHIFWMALRNGPLRKEVVSNPLKWPMAWWSFCRALVYAWRHRVFQPPLMLKDENP